MIVPGSANALLLKSAAPTGYNVERSLRFNSADSAYLSRTPSVAGNRKTWTWAGWVKRSGLSQYGQLLTGRLDDNNNGSILFWNDDKIVVINQISGSVALDLRTSQVFRDISAWYHIVCTVDTTQGTAANRAKIYVNGIEVSSYSTATYPSQNYDTYVNSVNAHSIGAFTSGSNHFSGYLADIHFIDGQALDPTSFTEVDATTGQLIPKAYAGSYGTNGFHLPFSDNSTAAALGTDTSGNSNTWTVNNISVAAGAGNDSLVDTPTSYGVDDGLGGSVRGNYCTWNPFIGVSTLSNGNLDISISGGGNVAGTTIFLPSSGKYYWEILCTSRGPTDPWIGMSDGVLATKAFAGDFATNDLLGFAFDADTGEFKRYKNGTLINTDTFTSSQTWRPAIYGGWSGSTSCSANFGQRPFAYTAPSGFKALCTTNLPAPVVAQPSTVMDVLLWSGSGAGTDKTISGLNFADGPDLVWAKTRNFGYHNTLFDSVRGYGQRNALVSDQTFTEGYTYSGRIKSANSTSITWENDGGSVWYDESGKTYVAWTWDAGSSTVTNTQGSITSTVRANPSAGFSIVTFTCPSSGAYSFGHGLGVAPSLVILKDRVTSGTLWAVYHSSVTSASQYLTLNSTAAITTTAGIWGAGINSTVVGSTANVGIVANNTGVAYCFAPVEGYSAYGSYTGNGSTDGPFVYTNMLPRWIMIKRTDTIGDWTIIDTARLGYNVDNNPLYPNLSDAEGTADLADILSNGFKLRTSDASVNASGGTYVYASFALSPFAYSRSR